MEMYRSELDVLKETASGSLWGLWSHSKKAVVFLAVPDADEQKLLEHCHGQKLLKVGEYNSKRPRRVNRPAGVNPTLTYLFLLRDDSGRPEVFHVDKRGDIHDVPEVNYLPKLSPYRYASDPTKSTDESGNIKQTYEKHRKPDGLSATHWASMPEHSRFLEELSASLKKNFEVKQILMPGSTYLAVFVQHKPSRESWAIGFPETFPSDRRVKIKVGSSPNADEIELPIDPKEAKNDLLLILKKSKIQKDDDRSQNAATPSPTASEKDKVYREEKTLTEEKPKNCQKEKQKENPAKTPKGNGKTPAKNLRGETTQKGRKNKRRKK